MQKHVLRKVGLMVVSLCLTISSVQATPDTQAFISSTLLELAQDRYPSAQIEVTVQPLDPRLRLGACDELEAVPRGRKLAGRVHVAVSCAGPKPWRVFVAAEINLITPVWVTRHPVARGALLTKGDLVKQRRNLTDVRGQPVIELAAQHRWSAARTLQAGEVLTLQTLRALPDVTSGERVQLRSTVGAATISTSGVALSTGAVGDQIRVRNTQSKRVVQAWIIAPGVVSTRPSRSVQNPPANQIAKSS